MAQEGKPPLIILTGPTAAGKTELSIQLAKAVGGEIISADSMQVYRGMDIGTAKITKEEQQGVRHHLIDILDPKEDFHVVKFQEMAKAAIKEIYSRGHIPILAGGTGFYIQAVLYDIDFDEKEETALRKELEERAAKEGAESLHEELSRVDPKAAQEIHANNVKRVIRALEFYCQTGKRISEHNEEQREKEAAYRSAYFVLTMDRKRLYERIDRRVDLMLAQGVAEEVKRLWEEGVPENATSMQGIGYKEFFPYLKGECSLEEAVYILKRDTRHFAKRQLTWFRRERDVLWIDKDQYLGEEEILAYMLEVLKEQQIIGGGVLTR